jgi:NAD(P)-dependent dehydrogenase (short-subunit alcohol dehydrogenase family)
MASPVTTPAVVITGASTGIGRACALDLGARGFRVFAGVRRDADGEQLAAAGPNITPLLIDVTDQASIAAAARTVGDAVGEQGLHGLVNNAGIAVSGPLEFIPLEELRRQLEVNLVGQIAVTQALLPLLRAARGRIVNVGSIGGRLALPFLGPYAASKFAMEGLSDSMRRELAPHGVRVCLIEPGAIATSIWERGNAAADVLIEQMPPEGMALYGDDMLRARAGADQRAREAIPPAEVADVVAHAMTSGRPRTRYLVGRPAKIMATLARVLPDRALDRLIARRA